MKNLVAGRRLDALIAKKIMGWRMVTDHDYHPAQREWWSVGGFIALVAGNRLCDGREMGGFSPSTDIADAFKVVNAISTEVGSPLKEFWFRLEKEDRRRMWWAEFSDPWSPRSGDTVPRFAAYAETAPLAICHAALLAMDAAVTVTLGLEVVAK